MAPTSDPIIVPQASAAQLALHARLAAHHAAAAGAEPAAAEAVLTWAVLVASGEAVADALDALPALPDILDEADTLPAYRAAADQAEQLIAHFDYEERFELVDLYSKVLSAVEGEIDRMTRSAARATRDRDSGPTC